MPKKIPQTDRGVVRVTFSMPAEVQAGDVQIAGEFTGWQGRPMERQQDGSWETSVDLEPARTYEYRYLLDGERWENDWAADRYVPNEFGFDNSVIDTPPLAETARMSTGAAAANKPTGQSTSPAKPKAKRPSAQKKAAAKDKRPAKDAPGRPAADPDGPRPRGRSRPPR